MAGAQLEGAVGAGGGGTYPQQGPPGLGENKDQCYWQGAPGSDTERVVRTSQFLVEGDRMFPFYSRVAPVGPPFPSDIKGSLMWEAPCHLRPVERDPLSRTFLMALIVWLLL